jgi:hypothetical protein
MYEFIGGIGDRVLSVLVPEVRASANECQMQYRCWRANFCRVGAYKGWRNIYAIHRRQVCADGYRGQWAQVSCGSC